MKELLQHGRNRLDGTRLKLVGIVLMFCDHIHQMFIGFGAPQWLTMLWRPVLPIFLFMLAEGMHYTRNRKRYLLLLFAGSIVMCFSTRFLQQRFPVESIALINNVFATLLVTGLYIVFYDMLRNGIKTKSVKKILSAIGLMIVPLIISALFIMIMSNIGAIPSWILAVVMFLIRIIPNVIFVEGGVGVVILGVLFYAFRKRKWAQIAILAAFSLLTYLQEPSSIQRMMIFAAIPILLYNGKKGKGRKYLFYAFYPLHIIILYLMAYFWG